jgi:hypothetical protein
VVAELGADVDPFVLHLFAALAEKERACCAAAVPRGFCNQRKSVHATGVSISAWGIVVCISVSRSPAQHLEIARWRFEKNAVERLGVQLKRRGLIVGRNYRPLAIACGRNDIALGAHNTRNRRSRTIASSDL